MAKRQTRPDRARPHGWNHALAMILGAIAIQWAALAHSQTSGGQSDAPSLSLPIDCSLGSDCWVQNLVDMDPGPGHRDPLCGSASFNTHKGTDFRLRTIANLKAEIPVRAMVKGTVVGLRNTMDDRLIESAADVAKIAGKECGNGVMVEHRDPALSTKRGVWTTQYCHLKKGSVVVKKGDTVERGQMLGTVGLSGHTTFPHVHVTVRRGKTVIDPLTGLAQPRDSKTAQSNGGDACLTGSAASNVIATQSLWNEPARDQMKQLVSKLTALLASGFTSAPTTPSIVMKDEVAPPSPEGPLLFYANFINLKKGDRINLLVKGPDGIFIRQNGAPLKADKATWTIYTGKKGAPTKGRYSARVTLIRNGDALIETDGGTVDIKP